ncbi:MAG: anti-sigma factor family protein [Anaerolineae bacterium]
MRPCELCRAVLPQYIADGEPSLPMHEALRAHLDACPACAAYATRLRTVEEALHAYPAVPAPPQVAARVICTVRTPARQAETWEPLPRSVWAPVLVTVIVTAMVFLSVGQLSPGLFWGNLEATFAGWLQPPEVMSGAPTLTIHPEDFWAVLCGIFVSIAGLGFCVALSSWNARTSKTLGQIEASAAERASRFWQNVRHAD